jgi:hypothetical protein
MGIRFLFPAFFAVLAFCPPAQGLAEGASVLALSADAQAQANAGYPHLAINDLERALAKDPNNVQLLRTDARLLAKCGLPKMAHDRWSRLAELSPEDAEAMAALRDVTVTAVTTVVVPTAANTPEAGLGLWMSGGGRDQVKEVNQYNAVSPQGQHVRYLFVRAGEWVLDGGRTHWDLDLDQALIAADELGGDATVYLWLDGNSEGAEQVSAATWDRMADEVSQAVAQHHLGGLLMAPACCGAPLYPFYTALRAKLNGAFLAVQVASDEPEVFQHADFAVLRPVPPKGDPGTYKDMVQDMAALFLRTADSVGGKAMVGLSGLAAKDPIQWYADGRHAVTSALPLQGSSFLGVSVWGLVADDEGQVSDLPQAVWKQMQLPLEHP